MDKKKDILNQAREIAQGKVTPEAADTFTHLYKVYFESFLRQKFTRTEALDLTKFTIASLLTHFKRKD